MLRWIIACLVLCGFVHPATARQPQFRGGAVAADHVLASKAGVAILARGGNAVDAAVATSFALSVTRPFSCGLGGGGFMVIWDPHRGAFALNYREVAPQSADPAMYAAADENSPPPSRYGEAAIAVPGTVAGLLTAHERFGRLSRQEVLAPAIDLAVRGFVPDKAYRAAIDGVRKRREQVPGIENYADEVLGTFDQHDRIRLPGQAVVLRRIAQEGREGFYGGDVALAIIESTRGRLTMRDLTEYMPRWEEPLVADIGDELMLIGMPPPSTGGVAVGQLLGMLHRLGAAKMDRDNPVTLHLLVESMKHAFADRAKHMADPQFAHVPVSDLLDPTYLDELSSRVQPDRTLPGSVYGGVCPPPDDSGTSHLSVVDSEGVVVVCTETINTSFGSFVLVPKFDFALNNEMDDFTIVAGQTNVYGLRQSDRNMPEPGKRPISSMSPTIVLRDGKPVLAIGASGGPRIITAVAQVVMDILWRHDDPVDAVSRPRLHHQWVPDAVVVEEDWDDAEMTAALEARGHDVTRRTHVGVVQVIEITPDGKMRPASDPRKGGRPAGID